MPGPLVSTVTNTVPLEDELEELEELLELDELPELVDPPELDEEDDALELLEAGLTPPSKSPESLELHPKRNSEHSSANTSLDTIILRFCRR